MNDFKESIETDNTLTGHIETNNTLTGSLNYFKGDSIFECWLQQEGNEGKTFEDFMNEVNIDVIGYVKEVDLEKKLDEYVTESELNDKLTDIPTKVSQLENDSNFLTDVPIEYVTETELNDKGYLTEHQDISNLALKSELHSHTNMGVLSAITDFKVNQWDNKSDFSGSYNDLTNKPTIPEQFVLPIANQTTLGGIKVGAGLNITSDGILSTTGGTADSIVWENVIGRPTNLSEFTNDSGFITETELTDKNYATKSELHSHSNKDILDNITQATINTISSAITYKGIVQSSGNLNNCTATGFYKIQQGAQNLPVNENSFLIVYNEPGQATLIQVWYSATSEKQRIRRRASYIWENWYTVYTENEPPTIPTTLPANGGNADTVNNIHFVALNQSEYDAITSKDSNTIYIIKEV